MNDEADFQKYLTIKKTLARWYEWLKTKTIKFLKRARAWINRKTDEDTTE